MMASPTTIHQKQGHCKKSSGLKAMPPTKASTATLVLFLFQAMTQQDHHKNAVAAELRPWSLSEVDSKSAGDVRLCI